MHRSIALVALLALSWSQLGALHCDMGAGPSTTAAHGASHALPPDTPSTPDHGGSHGCLMIMACGFASARQAHPVTIIRIPTVFVRTAFFTPLIPVAADQAVETPPPRHTV